MAGAPPPEQHNWRIAQLYARNEFDECLAVVEKALTASNGLNEYPLYVKALITRQRGEIQQALELFQAATCLNPSNVRNLKQVGHSLYLLGKHKAALGVYEQARSLSAELRKTREEAKGEEKSSSRRSKGGDDWELWHNSGLCHAYLKQYDEAINAFERANANQRHDATFLQLGKVYEERGDPTAALKVYQDALDFSPENPDLLTTIGLAYLRLDDHQRAFDYLGNALTHDPRNVKAILAVGSIIQDNRDMDVALHKYRVAAAQTPDSPQLWNNVGMALFGKGKNIAAISCLKKAHYLDPFEWIVAFNLGLVHLHTKQHASAFHFFNAAVNRKKDYAPCYMYMGVALSAMNDLENAYLAFEKSLKLKDDHTCRLNYAATLFNQGKVEDARTHFLRYEVLLGELGADADPEDGMLDLAEQLRSRLKT